MSSSLADVTAQIERLFVYPIKSCAGIELQESLLLDTGLEFDRAWMVVDGSGDFVTQRELPRMALIRPQLKTTEMVLRAPGMLALHVQLDAVEGPARVRVWKDEVPAYDMGDLAAQWFSDFLGQKLRMVRFDPDHRRLSNLKRTGGFEAPNQFSDGYPVLVTTSASMDELNARLARAGHAAVGMERFRPNIVLGGVPAHEEDRMERLEIAAEPGAVQLQLVKPCERCPVPNIDPASAVSHSGVSDALQTYRQDKRLDGAITFGMNAIVRTPGDHALRVGQTVTGDYVFE